MKPVAPDWLSLICQGGRFDEVENWLEVASEYGFKMVQPVFFWSEYSTNDFEKLSSKLKQLNLSAVAFGVYGDLYKWDKPAGACFESTIEDFKLTAVHASDIGTPNLVSWCGTVGDFAAPCEENRSDEVIESFEFNQKRLLPTLVEHDVAFLFEPWRDHILSDEFMTASACGVDSNHFKAVIDFPNFISPTQWPDRDSRILSIQQALSQYVGVVHLKDILVNEEGAVELPMFGRGEFTQVLADTVRTYIGKYPIIVEHFTAVDDVPELLENIKRYFE